jgi:DNA-binding Lrp family transcriptional regulator
MRTVMDEINRKIIAATQNGLPLTPHPYSEVGNQIGVTAEVVMDRMQEMLDNGIIRRIGIIPNHYKLGFKSNGMTVWDVPDDQIDQLGEAVGQLEFVSHCYQRPRHLPDWPYNLFAMVHGKTRNEVFTKTEEIRTLLGDAVQAYEILFSKKILKKSGFRLQQTPQPPKEGL